MPFGQEVTSPNLEGRRTATAPIGLEEGASSSSTTVACQNRRPSQAGETRDYPLKVQEFVTKDQSKAALKRCSAVKNFESGI